MPRQDMYLPLSAYTVPPSALRRGLLRPRLESLAVRNLESLFFFKSVFVNIHVVSVSSVAIRAISSISASRLFIFAARDKCLQY